VGPIVENAGQLFKTAAGRRVLLYLLLPRARRHFPPAMIARLAETDSVLVKTSKKDPFVRASEVRAAASKDLLAWISRDGHTLCRDTAGSLLVLEVMLEAEGGEASLQSLPLKVKQNTR